MTENVDTIFEFEINFQSVARKHIADILCFCHWRVTKTLAAQKHLSWRTLL